MSRIPTFDDFGFQPVELPDGPDFEFVHWMDKSCIPFYLEMEQGGVPIDLSQAESVRQEIADGMEALERQIHTAAGREWHIGSDYELRDILFKERRIKRRGPDYVLDMTPTGSAISCAKDNLKKIEHLAPDIITPRIEWKEHEKLMSTYADKLPRMVKNGKLHGTVKHTQTDTGRLAYEEPNLQNVPTRTKLGRKIRSFFTADPGCVILSQDYSQVEVRVLAAESGDERLLQVFRDGDDPHWVTAEAIFQKPREELDEKQHRGPSKNATFGIIYGIGPQGLYVQIVSKGGDLEYWSILRTEEFIGDYFREFNAVRRLLDRYKQRARRYGFVWDLAGRIRWLPEINARNRRVASRAERQTINMPIQGGAQAILKLSMPRTLEVAKAFRKLGMNVRPLIQVHDELLWSVDEDCVYEFAQITKRVMEEVVTLPCPLASDAEIGWRWSELEKMEVD